ncbi:MAG: hypothetical protein WBS16_07095 [Thermoplasmata archaeon]
MMFRTLLTLVNFATIAAAVAVLLIYPQYAAIAFYVLLGWMFASLALMYHPRASRPVTASASAPSGLTVSADSPLSSSSGHEHSSSIGFCMYCAAPIPPGTVRCPACGRSLPHFS